MIELTGLNKDFFDLFRSWKSYMGGDPDWDKYILEDLEKHGGVRDIATYYVDRSPPETHLIFIMNDGETIGYGQRHCMGIKPEDYLKEKEVMKIEDYLKQKEEKE